MTLYKALLDYKKSGIYPMHMPGHKRNIKLCTMPDPYGIDITEIDGFDNLHNASGILEELKNRVARIFGAKESFLLINGSTVGILATISATTNVGDTILIARNCHKSVYHAAMLRQLKVEYLFPKQMYAIDSSISPEDIEEAFLRNRNIKLVVITSPTYEGVVSDIKKIAEIVHQNHAKLLVDEAHGAHLGFSDYFPESAVFCQADFVVQSLHKTLPCLTQTAVLHTNQVDAKDKINFFLSVYETSSPSYLLLSSIDQCVTLLEERGEELFYDYTRNLKLFHEQISSLRNLSSIQHLKKNHSIFDLDSSKIVLMTGKTDLDGYMLYQTLLKKYRIQMEMSVINYALGMTSICDTKEGFSRLVRACQEIDLRCNTNVRELESEEQIVEPSYKKHFEIYETMQMKKKSRRLSDSLGEIAGDYICLYPPGTPTLVPGEEITGDGIEKLLKAKRVGLSVEGMDQEDMITVIDR